MSDRVRRHATLAAALASLGLQAAVLWSLRSWPGGLRAHVALAVLAGLSWLAFALLARAGVARKTTIALLCGATALRIAILPMPVVRSDDFHRYAWDARVQQHGVDPYRHAPEEPALVPLRDQTWARINNRHLPTIYPPLAQLAFRAAIVPWAPRTGWRLFVLACDTVTTALLAAGGGAAAALGWALCPLVLLELDLDLHVDALAIALFTAALLALRRRRRGLAGALLGAAAAVKLLPVFLLAALRDRRVLVAALLAIALAAAPFASAGARVFGSLGEFSRRWRANDGAFALLYVAAVPVAEVVTGRNGYLWLGPRGPWLTGRDRPDVFADELAAVLARAAAAALFVVILIVAVWRIPADELRPIALAEVGVGAFLLLTPVLHPWYVPWILPPLLLGADRRRAAWLWLAATVPLAHLPLADHLAGAGWHEAWWPRIVEHGPALVLCVRGTVGGRDGRQATGDRR
jgi:hypothetical protein